MNTLTWRNLIAPLMLLTIILCGCADVREAMRPPEPLTSAATTPPPSVRGEYKLGTGDVLSIRVYDWRAGSSGAGADDDLRLEKIRLDHTGIVSLPFGQFKASGGTLKELENAIVESLRGRLLRSPRVWVNIEEYRPFFVEGQVQRPGAYPFQPELNVRKAIAIGGGLKERASTDKVYVVREGDKSQQRIRVNLNSPIGPGDTITVEESFF